ncbi:monooxygenase [Methylobacterium pseudosasicola]|uniref:Acyl-CoA dehydrogenase n=1 Tax=Methylobacterium pseudosasicola TaxID=582667 RepID=A0A1I4HAS8_9HYPH|nr:monooxygenase [Methylobacterium pseudosasicola]SFL39314.1 Acyl-CoA dehydrogenase [Methylobacterium pseudosasicola]
MSQTDAAPWPPERSAWGSPPSPRYESLAARFRPIFARIREGAVARERERRLPEEAVGWLRAARFGALRVPEAEGGFGASLPDLFGLLAELAQADSNLPQALRNHFGFAEDTVSSPHDARRARWIERLAEGDLFGGAWSETGNAVVGTFETRIHRRGDGWGLTGRKYYTTGSLFADWIDVVGTGEAGEETSVVVSARAPGVAILDDWDGFGQRLTASGTATFADVPAIGEPLPTEVRFAYGTAFFQAVHLATLTGIARAAADAVTGAVRIRDRTYSHAAGARPSADPQVLQVVGRVHALAYAAGALNARAAEAVQRAYEARVANLPEAQAQAITIASEIELAQAQTVLTGLVLDAGTILFDALGASATSSRHALDRHWRNARTIASHNPRIFKDRIVGDFAVNGTEPPFQWKIGRVLPAAS